MDWQYALYILIGLVTSFVCFYHWKRRKLYFLAAQLPGPPALPFIGNGLTLFCKSADLLNQFLSLTDSYSSPLRIWLGPRLVIYVKDPTQLQILMQSPKLSTKSFVYRFLEPFMGKGLFTSSGLQHKSQRKLLQHMFGPKFLEGYSHLFQKHAIKFAEDLKSYVNKEEFDILLLLHASAFKTTMDIMVEGKKDHSVDYEHLPAYVRRFYHIFSQRIASFWMHPDWIYRMTSFCKEENMMAKEVIRLTEEAKNDRIPELLSKLKCEMDVNKNESRTPSILELMMEMVLENPGCLNETEFKDHMLTFIATSQDTQSSAIAFTLMMLGMHPDIQRKVMLELKEIVGERKYVEFDDVAKLKYMEMCIKESMRLFPLGPFLPRDVVEDFQLEKWILPAGCSVVLGVYHVHRNPDLWEKPNEFYPEHFTSEAVSNRHPYAFLPFSAGPRRCIAQQYSYVNMKIIVGTILLNYVVECPGTLDNLKLLTDVSIRPVDGYLIRIKSRNCLP